MKNRGGRKMNGMLNLLCRALLTTFGPTKQALDARDNKTTQAAFGTSYCFVDIGGRKNKEISIISPGKQKKNSPSSIAAFVLRNYRPSFSFLFFLFGPHPYAPVTCQIFFISNGDQGAQNWLFVVLPQLRYLAGSAQGWRNRCELRSV